MPSSPPSSSTYGRQAAVKVPEIAALFWIIKLLTTGMGESASDYLAHLNLVLAGVVGLIGFCVALWWQLRARTYVARVYWFAVAMVAVFGTMAADGVHVGLGVPYVVSSAFWAAVLAIAFYRWHRSEGTLSIHSITTRRRETYYWVTVLATFALGTALGDLTATELHLGFFASAVLFAVIMLVPAIGWWRFGMNSVLAFWFAYVLTRPLGASIADWLGKPHSFDGGLGLGDGAVTAVAIVLIVAFVAYAAKTRCDVQRTTEPAPSGEAAPSSEVGAEHAGFDRVPELDADGVV